MSDLPQDDIDWINKHVLITETVPDSWIKRAIELRSKRDKEIIDGKVAKDGTVFRDTIRWCSLLGEYYVSYYFKDFLTDNNKGDWVSKHDFTAKNGKKADVKTLHGSILDLEHKLLLLKNEIKWDNYDFIIFTYFCTGDNNLTILGWLTKDDFIAKAEVLKKGTDFCTPSGKFLFKLEKDNYAILQDNLKTAAELEQFCTQIAE